MCGEGLLAKTKLFSRQKCMSKKDRLQSNFKSGQAQQQKQHDRMVTSTVFATAASVIPTMAAASAPPANPPLACHGPCRTRCASTYDPRDVVGPASPLAAVPRFYLHDEGGFNLSGVSAAVDRLLGGSPPDDVLPVDMAEHFFECPLLRALRTHPQRTLSAGDAEVHVIGAMPFVSWALADMGICLGACPNGSLAEHQRRMHGVAEALRSNRYWNTSRQQGTPFVLIAGHFSHHGHITEALAQELSRGNAVLAVADLMHAEQMPAPKDSPLRGLVSRGITVPYWAHAHAAYMDGDRAERAGIMFHGGVGRHDYGTRDRLVKVMRLLQERGDPVDLRLAEFTRGGGVGAAWCAPRRVPSERPCVPQRLALRLACWRHDHLSAPLRRHVSSLRAGASSEPLFHRSLEGHLLHRAALPALDRLARRHAEAASEPRRGVRSGRRPVDECVARLDLCRGRDPVARARRIPCAPRLFAQPARGGECAAP